MSKPPRPSGLVQDARLFARSPALSYLAEEDRFISRAPRPALNFAIVGCGIMGTEHIRNTLLEGRAAIAGVLDPSPDSVAGAQREIARYGQDQPATVYPDIEALCADERLDAVFVCTPNFTHLSLLRELAAADKALFLEKPIATTVDDAWQVCQLAARHPKLVRIGLQYRYKAIYAEAIHEVLERGSIGRVHAINLLEHRFPFLDKVGQWNKFNEFTGGTLIEKCCHYFDLMNLFAGGRPQRVYASGHHAVNFSHFDYHGRRADGLDHASVIVDYDNHTVASFQLCMFAPGETEQLIVNGEQGRLRAEESASLGGGLENALEIWRGEQGVSRRTQPHYPKYIEKAGHRGSTFFEHVDFVDDLLDGSNTGPTLADGFWSVVVGAAAQRSIETGGPVAVDDCLPADFEATLLYNDAAAAGEAG
ncbi:MAG: Gfo/Idh/MocA family oxidoreductase [Pseudomonadota bacterium]